jgi:hypothetical protein
MSDYAPRSPLTQQEAIQSITRRELREVREKFGVALVQDFSDESKLEECMWALTWLFERRADPAFTDDQLDDMSLGEVMNYFTEVPLDQEGTAAGKEPATTPTISPNGASSPVSAPESATL